MYRTPLVAIGMLVAGIAGMVPASAQERVVTLIAADRTQVKVTSDTSNLPPEINAKSVRVLVKGGPVKMCANVDYRNPCITIFNRMIACELENCFAGAGDWRNRIKSVVFLTPMRGKVQGVVSE